jgi:hypothetical protein
MVAQATLTKQGNALVTLFVKAHTEKYGVAPKLNRYKAKWGFQSMIEDLGYERSKEIVEYYFRTGKQGHPVEFLHMNYERIADYYEERKRDEEKRAELRRLTEQQVREWEEKNG